MTWIVVAALNGVIAAAYFAIALTIFSGLSRTRQLTSNKLAFATFAIFLTCGVHHGAHTFHMALPSFGFVSGHGLAMRAAFDWHFAVGDAIGALVALTFLGLRRSYGPLLGSAQMFEDGRLASYRTLAHNFPNGFVLLFDRNLRFHVAGGTEIAISGRAPEAYQGRALAEAVSAEERELLEPAFVAALAGEDRSFEYESGSRIISMHVSPTRNGDEIDGGIVVAYDVTEQRAAERERGLFAAIVASSGDAMLSTTRDGIVTSWNAASERIYGYPADEIVGRPVSALVPPIYRAESATFIETVLAGGNVIDHETRRLRKDGTEIDVSVSLSPVLDASGAITGVAGIVRDISARKREESMRQRLEQRLREGERRESLGILAGGVAHDFNNLLVGMLGNADLALRELPEDAPARERVDRIVKAASLAGDLTNQMLAYSGKGTFVVEPLRLSDLVREMDVLLGTAISKKARLHFDLPAGLPLVKGDATQLRQIVLNLTTNAAEALGDGVGEIHVRTDTVQADASYLLPFHPADGPEPGPYVRLVVADTGRGMDQPTIARIFDPFFTTKFTGRGLGLSGAMGIVESHSGAIAVESEIGAGTILTVLLPVVEGRLEAEPARAASEGPAKGAILVVDDEETVRTVAGAMLEHAGYEVVLAVDGDEAVEVFAASPDRFACVLLDMMMPGRNGDEVYREVKARRPDTPVVLSSGYSAETVHDLFGGDDASVFVQKPYLAGDLLDAVQRACAQLIPG